LVIIVTVTLHLFLVLLFGGVEFFKVLDGFGTFGEVERVKVFDFFKSVA